MGRLNYKRKLRLVSACLQSVGNAVREKKRGLCQNTGRELYNFFFFCQHYVIVCLPLTIKLRLHRDTEDSDIPDAEKKNR